VQVTEMNILAIILESGFVVKGVLISLIIASIISWAVVLKKSKSESSLQNGDKKFLEIFNSSKSMSEVMQKCDEIEFSPYKIMFFSGYQEFLKIKNSLEASSSKTSPKEFFSEHGFAAIERALKKGMNEGMMKREENLSILASIGSVTPFIGLFGTVWGIIDSFTGLAGGGGTLDAVAPGIAEALVATAVGLAAAIPAVLFYNHYNNRNARSTSEMENFGQDFLNMLERSVLAV
tara:strand:+ start:244 stop:945 length:702 start_codon:yes stop_codon:yes gene_type:complete